MEGIPPIPLLLAEDEALLRLLLEEALAEAGFEVTAVSSAEQAIAAFEANPEKVRGVITDIRLGGSLTGWDVASQARERVATLPIVYMSGDAANEWASKGVPNSVMLTKPFAPAQLVTAISQLMNGVPPPPAAPA